MLGSGYSFSGGPSGPTFGGIMTHVVSWHWIFALNVPLAAVVIVMARSTVPATASNVRGPLDVAGIVSLAIGLLATMGLMTRLYAYSGSINGALAWSMVVAPFNS